MTIFTSHSIICIWLNFTLESVPMPQPEILVVLKRLNTKWGSSYYLFFLRLFRSIISFTLQGSRPLLFRFVSVSDFHAWCAMIKARILTSISTQMWPIVAFCASSSFLLLRRVTSLTRLNMMFFFKNQHFLQSWSCVLVLVCLGLVLDSIALVLAVSWSWLRELLLKNAEACKAIW